MKIFKLNKQNVNNIESDICFLSAGNKYDINFIPSIKQVIIFVPYCQQSNIFKANAKKMSIAFQGASVIIVDTKYTAKSARSSHLKYSEANSTLILAIDYILNNGYDQVEVEDLKCNPQEQNYLNSLVSQAKVRLIKEEENIVQNVQKESVPVK